MSAIGSRILRRDARQRAEGTAQYTSDLAVPGMLHGVLVRSTLASGRLVAVDTSAAQSVPAEIRVYNPLFSNPAPDAANFVADLNPDSLEVLRDARIEPALATANSDDVVQFERQGYFVRDRDSTPEKPVFNRTIGLRDSFAKETTKP